MASWAVLLLLCMSSASSQCADLPQSTFAVVIFRSRTMRLLFQRMLDLFQCPKEREACRFWYLFKSAMGEPEAMEDFSLLPVLAMMRGGWTTASTGAPCAAAFYTDAHCEMSNSNTFVLEYLIRDAGTNCRGAGAAILCYLIRHSKDKEDNFSPLKLSPPIDEEPELKLYYESFGCVGTNTTLYCNDPNPEKCEGHDDEFFDADAYYRSSSGNLPEFFAQMYRDLDVEESWPLIGIATVGAIFAFLHSYCGNSLLCCGKSLNLITDEEPTAAFYCAM
eukprot:gnl/TRDRNA2_/TRDRNA2_201911_c0_seq1.p1 gnl/TRDRNA2_/TRDRNA2_201911_c0~~gnl/TRDRNA2_/TRDRNA2_201911_c0_seq1.p1  ORF type:complete len:277 (+),score=37.64 gnl/TRDRNA2_/TRDRNA2_201911_c0_seq1:128-958(+)